jgi:hypothetical protein
VKIRLPPNNQTNVISQINGFYGLIGPSIETHKIRSLFHLFTGHGVVQGVFFQGGNMTFIKSHIETDIYKFERKYFSIEKHPIIIFIGLLLHPFRMFPSIIGVANTSLMQIYDKLYVFFERDKPYLLNFNYNDCSIDTIEKIKGQYPERFSGHTKFVNGTIETLDYSVLLKKVYFYFLTPNMTVISKVTVDVPTIPLIHDFYSTEKYIYFILSPLQIRGFHKNERNGDKTILYRIDKKTLRWQTFTFSDNFFVFHIAKIVEKGVNQIAIYASIYNEVDFFTTNFHLLLDGQYSKINVDYYHLTDSIMGIYGHNLDFPISYGKGVILRNIEKQKINGFILVNEKLNILKKYIFDEYQFCGEPQIVNADGNDYLISFVVGGLVLIHLETREVIHVPIPCELFMGFHSIFLLKREGSETVGF